MWFYHQNILSSPFSLKDMLLQENAHQCGMRSLPWEHPPNGQNYIWYTCFVALKGFGFDNLQSKLSTSQVMAKHHRNV